jgi:hypothetical protein
MTILDDATSPAAAAAQLRAGGIRISERTLKERARALGACRYIGKAMFLMPEDLNVIVDAAKREAVSCRNSQSVEKSGTTVSPWTETDAEDLRARLTKSSQKKSQ